MNLWQQPIMANFQKCNNIQIVTTTLHPFNTIFNKPISLIWPKLLTAQLWLNMALKVIVNGLKIMYIRPTILSYKYQYTTLTLEKITPKTSLEFKKRDCQIRSIQQHFLLSFYVKVLSIQATFFPEVVSEVLSMSKKNLVRSFCQLSSQETQVFQQVFTFLEHNFVNGLVFKKNIHIWCFYVLFLIILIEHVPSLRTSLKLVSSTDMIQL